jgi:hypothetical protein
MDGDWLDYTEKIRARKDVFGFRFLFISFVNLTQEKYNTRNRKSPSCRFTTPARHRVAMRREILDDMALVVGQDGQGDDIMGPV